MTDRQWNTAPPFKLEIKKADINCLDNIVKLVVKLTDKRFNTTLDRIDKLLDKNSDVIDTVFWWVPDDVVIRAVLTRNEENTTTSNIPGTNGALAPLTPLIGGTDKFTTNLSETIIFMVPTVIDPSSEN